MPRPGKSPVARPKTPSRQIFGSLDMGWPDSRLDCCRLNLLAASVVGTVAVPLPHEAVEFLAVPRHAEVPHVVVELLDFLVEALTLLLETAKLFGPVLVERGIAARPAPAAIAIAIAMVTAVAVLAPGLGLAHPGLPFRK